MPFPKRIISLVPSITELLFHLELDKEIIGITKFCIHPPEKIKNYTKIGGTKNPDIDKIISLKPDLIIASKEENNKVDIDALSQYSPILLTNVSSYQEALEMILQVGTRCQRINEAQKLCTQIEKKKSIYQAKKTIPCIYMIWYNPWMTVGNDTFIADMLALAGMPSVINQKRYPSISIDELKDLKPSHILLSSEPFPFKEKHKVELQTILPDSKIVLVDGEMFSWYGSKMLESFDYFSSLHEKLAL
ncbi:MAG: helical backbone metal receptor [Chitinophagaceae bacterium]